MVFAQPAQILLGTGPREAVIDDDGAAPAEHPVGEVGSDKTGPAGDQDRLALGRAIAIAIVAGRHRVNPRAASAARASPTRSTAIRPSSQPTSFSRPDASEVCGRNPRTARAAADIREAVADIADPAFAGDFRLDRHPERFAEKPRGFLDRHGLAAADVEGAADRRVGDQRQAARFGDVGDIDKIAALLAVLEDQRRASVQQPGGEYRQHAGIGIGQRLVRAIGVEESQRDRRDVISLADHEAEPLLVVFREGINRLYGRRLGLRGRHRLERPPAPIQRVPLPAFQLQWRCARRPRPGFRPPRDRAPRHKCSCWRRRRADRRAGASRVRSSLPTAPRCRARLRRCSRRPRTCSGRPRPARRDGSRHQHPPAARRTIRGERTSPTISSTLRSR